MALNRVYLDYMSECTTRTVGDLHGKTMLELGDQAVTDETISEKTGKEYFENRGVTHISVDLNGQHGALRINLAKPIKNPKWQNYFDIITNSGTLEHVEPRRAQYTCFKNVHDCLKVGGIAIHLLPDIDALEKESLWEKHCNNYYSRDFVKMLVENNNYELISLRIIKGQVCPCFRKKMDVPFMKDRKKFLRYITRKKGGVVYRGINDTIFSRICNLPYRIARKIYHYFRIKK
jgi:SAM-dependent methyltransferase